MACDQRLCCSCPFCSPRRLHLNRLLKLDINWRLSLILILLLVKGGFGRTVRLEKDPNNVEEISKDPQLATIYAQKIQITNKSGEVDCTATDTCGCAPIGKCKPCSRINMSHQLAECLISGYKQRAYCSDKKATRYISCHYIIDPQEASLFWLVEGSFFALGTLAYSVVYLRLRKMEQKVARRIQQQIDA